MAVMVVVVLMSTVNNGGVNQTIEYSITFGGAHMVYSRVVRLVGGGVSNAHAKRLLKSKEFH